MNVISPELKINRQNVEDILALTPIQEAMLFHYLNEPSSELYFEQLSISFSCEADEKIIKKCWDFVSKSNEMLRTVFIWQDLNKPLQIVLKHLDIPFKFIDLSCVNEKMPRDYLLKEIREKDRKQKIDLKTNPFRIILCKINDREFEMIISNHHILYDGWSTGILLKEFFITLNSFCENNTPLQPTNKSKYKQVVKWYQQLDLKLHENFWSKYLKGLTTGTLFPVDYCKNQNIKAVENCREIIQPEVIEKLRNFTLKNELTLACVFYAAWGILLRKYCNTDDVVFGTTVSGRIPEIIGIDEIVGLFINTIPLRISVIEKETVKTFLKRVGKYLKEREEFEYTPQVNIKQYSELQNSDKLFNSVMVIENYPLSIPSNSKTGRSIINSFSTFEMTNYDLLLEVRNFEDFDLSISYNTQLFEHNTIKSILNHLINIIEQISKNTNQYIKEIQFMNLEEYHKVIYEFNTTDVDYPKSKTIHQLFEEQVAQTPDRIAICYNSTELTYQELNEKSNQLARYLIKNGITEEKLVGLIVTHSIEAVIGILAIIKAGGAFLPIDPEYPKERILFMIEDSGINILLTNYDINYFHGTIVNIHNNNLYTGDGSNISISIKSSNLVYVIYTSGSTGNPKGTLIEHKGLVNYCCWAKEQYMKSENETFALYSSLSFDLTITSIFTPLISGGKIIVYRDDGNEYVLYKIMRENKTTIIKLTPSHLSLLKDLKNKGSSLKSLIVGGENLEVSLAKSIHESFDGDIDIFNEYGPTETTIGCMIHKYDYEHDIRNSVPIGIPANNVKLYVLDKSLNPVPIGCVGELYISGDGVARGYLNKPVLTNERFVENKYMNEKKMYKTGDLVKFINYGIIEFVGRNDTQIKIRGFRIELEEIKKQILIYKNIKEVVIVVHKDVNRHEYLCAYFVANNKIDIEDLRQFLLSKLPSYMVPTFFIPLEKLPLTINGKLNSKLLPLPSESIEGINEYKAPGNEIELQIAKIWQKLLEIEKVSVSSNFFDIGGNSLLLIQMQAQLQKYYPGKVTMADIFLYPTISKLAGYIETNLNNNLKQKKPVQIVPLDVPEIFLTNGEVKEYNSLKFEIENEVYRNISLFSERENVEVPVILLSIYIYLLAKMTSRDEITIQTMLNLSNQVTSLTVNLKDIKDFYELFKIVNNKLKFVDLDDTYYLEDVLFFDKKNDATKVIPLVYNKNLLVRNFDLTNVYDLILEMNEIKDTVIFKIEYERIKLSESNLETMIKKYLSLITVIINNYLI